jgi:hypothetical protein
VTGSTKIICRQLYTELDEFLVFYLWLVFSFMPKARLTRLSAFSAAIAVSLGLRQR